jgi:hypothetical protein
MFPKIVLALSTVALAMASSAGNYRITLLQPSLVHGTELKAGDYKLEVDNDKAVFRNGKKEMEAPVKVESGDEKFSRTTFKYNQAEGKYQLQEIRIGGSHTKLVFEN